MELARTRIVVESVLALGGMAEVLRGRLEGPHGFVRPVVLKRMKRELLEDDELRTMFLDEARLLARIRHPHVAQVYGLADDDGATVLVMEHVPGPTLRAVLEAARQRGVRLHEELALALGLTLAETLTAIHALTDDAARPLGVVHRDLHPSNVVVGDDGVLKLLDFGIARAATAVHDTSTGVVKGTDGYMAPEQAAGERVGQGADVYALGILLHEMLTGSHPFAAFDGLALLDRLGAADGPAPRAIVPSLPIALDALVVRAMSRSAGDRPSASELASTLALELGRRGAVPTYDLVKRTVASLFAAPEPARAERGASETVTEDRTQVSTRR
ncbi:MAG: serine/threonine protein kinase [Deltaproteobacteria bacterium]|nr:serine/threonine protein kinase [Deltaproteobacteria bacterium]